MLFVSRNLWTTPEPKVYPAPLYATVRNEERSISMQHVREEAEGGAVVYVEPSHPHCPWWE